jgi:hypothetical protein
MSDLKNNRRVRNYGYAMGATSGTETPNSSRAPEYTPRFYFDSCYSIFSFLFILLSIALCPFFFAHCVVCPYGIEESGIGFSNVSFGFLIDDCCHV